MFEVRPEVESDREAIYDLHLRAFDGRFEPELVDKIRAGDNFIPELSLVAVKKAGLSTPFDVPDEAFMVCELAPGALKGFSGMVQYPPEFDEDEQVED